MNASTPVTEKAFIRKLNMNTNRLQHRLDGLKTAADMLGRVQSEEEFLKALDIVENISNAFEVELGLLKTSGARA